VIGFVLRVYSYLFHLALAALLLGVALDAFLSRSHTLRLEMLPWTGRALTYWLLGSALFGLLSIVFAWIGKGRSLFLLYALAVFGMVFRGYFLSAYSFHGKEEFRLAAWITGGAFLAIFGAWSQFRKKLRKSNQWGGGRRGY
jgi:hypothetical protein